MVVKLNLEPVESPVRSWELEQNRSPGHLVVQHEKSTFVERDIDMGPAAFSSESDRSPRRHGGSHVTRPTKAWPTEALWPRAVGPASHPATARAFSLCPHIICLSILPGSLATYQKQAFLILRCRCGSQQRVKHLVAVQR
jgi:hypothetical protein